MNKRARNLTVLLRAGLILSVLCTLVFLLASPSPSQENKPQTPPIQQQPAQEQAPFRIKTEVNLVTVPVTVRKQAGGFIKSLPKEAFHITEDGKSQQILTFEQEGVPAQIAIVLDISGSVRPEWGTIKYATSRFLGNLKPDDRFSLIAFNTQTYLKMDWGNKLDRLDDVLTSIYCKGDTNLWDTIYAVSTDFFKDIEGKKAMIIMTDGLDNNSVMQYKEALDAAVHSQAAIYVVSKTAAVRQAYIAMQQAQSVYQGIPEDAFIQADLALRNIAYETGGRVLYPNTFGQLDNVYAEVDEELRNQYMLGYISANAVKDGAYRKIEVTVDSPGSAISFRPGYYAPVRK
jgi:Ca-activated chloride channel family protein